VGSPFATTLRQGWGAGAPGAAWFGQSRS